MIRRRVVSHAAVVLAAFAALSGCATPGRVKKLESDLSDRDEMIANLKAENADLKSQLSKARGEIALLNSELKEAQKKAARAAAPPPPPAPAQPQERVLLVLDGDSFAPGKDTLSPAAKKQIRAALQDLRRAARNSYLRIEGHTDNQPIRKTKKKYASNIDLAAARAMSVLSYLETAGRIPPDKMYVAAYGPYRPIASNSSALGRARNRRVQVVATPK